MISVIIPTYNEESAIQTTLAQLTYSKGIEVIVADGGSSDRTIENAKEFPVHIIQCSKGRALQMNRAARIARGSVLLFLHADCTMEDGFYESIQECVNNGFVGGCFSQKIQSPRFLYRLIESSGNARARLFKIFYGDQAIFVCRDTFCRLRGFDEVDLFDDIRLSRKLKREGRTCVLNKRVYTSARRWEKIGMIKTTLINWILAVGFLLRVPSTQLKKIYKDVR